MCYPFLFIYIFLYKCTSNLVSFYSQLNLNISGRHHDNEMVVSQMTCSVCHCHNSVILFLRSWLITGFKTGVTSRVPRADQELFILPTLTEHLSWPSVLVGFSFLLWTIVCHFSFNHCIVRHVIYGF